LKLLVERARDSEATLISRSTRHGIAENDGAENSIIQRRSRCRDLAQLDRFVPSADRNRNENAEHRYRRKLTPSHIR